MKQETKICQNCKQNFTIEPEDFAFYEKIKVPAPTFCPDCRFQRRLMFRNERNLYKRKCDLCGKNMLAVFSPDKPYKVYCSSCWWSDKWDALEFGQEYNPTKPFFEQFKELQRKVPYMNLVVDYPSLINSDYVNYAGYLKNCYLVFDADHSENCLYMKQIDGCKDSMDGFFVVQNELTYEMINSSKCFKTYFSEDCSDCVDVWFSKNLVGCNNCFGCINLRNKKYHFFNKPLFKEEYENKIKNLNISSFNKLINIENKVLEFWKTQPQKFMHGVRNANVSGDYVNNSKNVFNSYCARDSEDSKYLQFITMKPVKDSYDYTEWGNNAQNIYESITTGQDVNNIKFSYACWTTSMNIEYCMYVRPASDCFGCIGVKKKQYCILNKQYSKLEYEELRKRIIQDMEKNPYIDSKGRVYKYGEFFPYDLSLFDYNETTAMQYFSLSEEEVIKNGFRWREQERKNYQITVKSEDLPDDIKDVTNSIIDEIIECSHKEKCGEQCTSAFKILPQELQFYRKADLPLPRLCPNCRHYQRVKRMNPPKLWKRKCQCNSKQSAKSKSQSVYTNTITHFHGDQPCPNEFKTTYSPDRPEIVYCERCYQQETV